jgi:hypothetical protein
MSNRHTRLARLVALAVVVSMPLVGMAGVASATKVKAGPNCTKHPNRAVCKAGGGGGTGGPGNPGVPPNIIVFASPGSVQEVGTSEADFVIQVEALPIFANQKVDISSQQLFLDCLTLDWRSSADGTTSDLIGNNVAGVSGVILDNEGNATVEVQGEDCAPGLNSFEADLDKAPYTTAPNTVNLLPPGVTKFPTITGAPNPEVETGDNAPGNAESQVYANFLIEEDPVYAEQIVDVTSGQLTGRCEAGTTLWSSTPGLGGGGVLIGTIGVSAVLDNDGNADVTFEGISCASGDSRIDAELVGGVKDSFFTTFTIKPPAVTDI